MTAALKLPATIGPSPFLGVERSARDYRWVERLDPAFFDLRSGVAGEFAQKFVNYGRRVAIVGDISEWVERSTALRDFVRECNRGQQLRFVADVDELG